MANHQLHLNPQSFSYIASGQKTVENRLFDEKRGLYVVSDTLTFINNETNEKIHATIVGLHRAPSFKALFKLTETQGKYSTVNIDELLTGTALHYTPQQEKRYGVVGIEFILNL